MLQLIVFSRSPEGSQSVCLASTLQSAPTLTVQEAAWVWESIIHVSGSLQGYTHTHTHTHTHTLTHTHCTGTLQTQRDDRAIWLYFGKGVPRPSAASVPVLQCEWSQQSLLLSPSLLLSLSVLFFFCCSDARLLSSGPLDISLFFSEVLDGHKGWTTFCRSVEF